MNKFCKKNFLVFWALFFFLFLPSQSLAAATIKTDMGAIFNKYSKYLDTTWKAGGWIYNVPSRSYREVNYSSVDDIRMQATFASAYLYRNDNIAKEKVRFAVNDFLADDTLLGTIRNSKRSFNDAIGLYLFLNIIEVKGKWFSEAEKNDVIIKIKKYLPAALRAPDEENRAFIGAAFGLAALESPLLNYSQTEKAILSDLARAKINNGLKSVDKKGVYHEGRGHNYSLHYHLVSADCLWLAGKILNDKIYQNKAAQMLGYVHHQYPLRRLTWEGSERPTGVGMQTVFLRAVGESYLGNKDWYRYWKIERLRHGFIDLSKPNRLVWYDEVDKTFNDDYSFLSMAVLFGNNLFK
jgi:hypothetical protein